MSALDRAGAPPDLDDSHSFVPPLLQHARRSSYYFFCVTGIAVWLAGRPERHAREAALSILLCLISDHEPVREHHALAQLHLSNLFFLGGGNGIERDPPRALELLYHVHHTVKHPEVRALSSTMLGDVWFEGRVGPVDLTCAYRHYLDAAHLAPALAERLYRAGAILEQGHPTEGVRDRDAFQHYMAASRLGHLPAKVRLAELYCSPRLAMTRRGEGIELFRQAAAAGSAAAARALRALGIRQPTRRQPAVPQHAERQERSRDIL